MLRLMLLAPGPARQPFYRGLASKKPSKASAAAATAAAAAAALETPIEPSIFVAGSLAEFNELAESTPLPVIVEFANLPPPPPQPTSLLLQQPPQVQQLQSNSSINSLLLDSLVAERKAKVRLVKLHPRVLPEVAKRFDVSHLPTLMLLKHGRVVERWENEMGSTREKQCVARAAIFYSVDTLRSHFKRVVAKHEETCEDRGEGEPEYELDARFKLAGQQFHEMANLHEWLIFMREQSGEDGQLEEDGEEEDDDADEDEEEEDTKEDSKQ